MDQQRLIFTGREVGYCPRPGEVGHSVDERNLANCRTVANHKISEGSVLHLLLCLVGC